MFGTPAIVRQLSGRRATGSLRWLLPRPRLLALLTLAAAVLVGSGMPAVATAEEVTEQTAARLLDSEPGEGLDRIRAGGVLRVVTLGQNPPFAFVSPVTGGLAGFDVDLARAIGRRLEVAVQFVEADQLTAVGDILQRGEADVAVASAVIPETLPPVGATMPYLVGAQGVLIRAELAEAVRWPLDLDRQADDGSAAYVVATVRDTPGAKAVAAHLPHAIRRTFGVPADAIRELRSGQVDAVAYDQPWLTSFQHARDPDGQTVLLAEPLAEHPYRLLTRRDQYELLATLNQVLSELKRDEALADLQARYLESEAWRTEYGVPFRDLDETLSESVSWAAAVGVLVAVAVLIVVFVTIIVMLTRQHRQQLEKEAAEAAAATAGGQGKDHTAPATP